MFCVSPSASVGYCCTTAQRGGGDEEEKSRRMRWARHVAGMWEERNVYRILVRKSTGKRSGRPRSMWVNNIKRDTGEIGWETVD
jgi:hypothetical protein